MRAALLLGGTAALVTTAVAMLGRRTGPSAAGGVHLRSRGRRNAELARLEASVGTTYASTAARKVFASAERRIELDREHELKTADAVTERLGHMKGALMKLGQMASYLDDGLPEPLRVALGQLQSSAPPMSSELAAGVIEAELGARPEDLFVEWDPTPIAAASIGQVHRAIVKDPDSGIERDAVKVSIPASIRRSKPTSPPPICSEPCCGKASAASRPEEMVNEIKSRIIEELDYRREAENQQAFADYYRGHPFVHVPDVIASLSTGRVLTTELATGHRFEEVLGGLATNGTWPERPSSGSCSAACTGSAFNGDPHPGNYLFRPGGQVTFLDFGLVKHFTGAEMATFQAMITAAVLHPDPSEYRRIVEGAGMLHAGRAGRDGEGRGVLQPLLRTRARGRRDDLDAGVRLGHRAPRLRSHLAHRAMRDRAPGVRVHPADQSRVVRAARSARASGNYRRISEELWPMVGRVRPLRWVRPSSDGCKPRDIRDG
ncbi:MAG: AarF/UbiB family protein [Ilumatobacteraceae bacterium]